MAEHARQISPSHSMYIRHWQELGLYGHLGSQAELTLLLHEPPGSQQGQQVGLSDILSKCVTSPHMLGTSGQQKTA